MQEFLEITFGFEIKPLILLTKHKLYLWHHNHLGKWLALRKQKLAF